MQVLDIGLGFCDRDVAHFTTLAAVVGLLLHRPRPSPLSLSLFLFLSFFLILPSSRLHCTLNYFLTSLTPTDREVTANNDTALLTGLAPTASQPYLSISPRYTTGNFSCTTYTLPCLRGGNVAWDFQLSCSFSDQLY